MAVVLPKLARLSSVQLAEAHNGLAFCQRARERGTEDFALLGWREGVGGEVQSPGGFILDSIERMPGPLIDPIGRAALAKTTIQGTRIAIVFDGAQSADEQSVSIFHELLEGLTVALPVPPAPVADFCEGDFEREARAAFQRFGVATPATVLAFLASFDFR